jgi:hypothetical protein
VTLLQALSAYFDRGVAESSRRFVARAIAANAYKR